MKKHVVPSALPKRLPFARAVIADIMDIHPTPFYLYDERAIRENAKRFLVAFSVFDGFKEYFAVKANPNPFILKVLREEGFCADCSSLAELELAGCVGIRGEDIMFSSNDTPLAEFEKALSLGAVINLDDIGHISFLERLGLPDLLCFRYNPGSVREGNAIIGDPKEAKFGLTREQLFDAYALCLAKGVRRFGLHTMVASNELREDRLVKTVQMLFLLAVEIKERLGITLEFINLGGGIGIPYRPDERAVDYASLAVRMKSLYNEIIVPHLGSVRVVMECGRVITGPYGYLVMSAIHLKHTCKDYVGCDASMADLMRPGMYGAYHHITVLDKEGLAPDRVYDVTGSLCENNDKFAVDRHLPNIEEGDILVIHDAGAHGYAMGFNYNGKLRCAELLLRQDGSVIEIRRKETVDDYFRTLDFCALGIFR